MKRHFSRNLILTGAAALLLYKVTRHRYRLEGKNVFITGGSRGLGMALAEEFGARGARLVICAREAEETERAATALRESGFDVTTVVGDVTQEAQAQAMIQHFEEQHGPIDVLVNNAGRIEVGPLEVATLQDFEKAMATHFWGPLYLMLAVIPGMKRIGGGRIVNISSIGGKLGVPHLVPYDASKFALAGLSEAAAAELRKDNIFVSTVYPGLMRTGSPRNANFKGQHRKEYSWFSVSDSLPLLTISARRAARKIVDACQNGQASLVITPSAKIASFAHAILPNTVIKVLALVNRLLPKAGGIGTESRKGHESQTVISRSPLTALTQVAARNLNQMGAR